MIGPDKEIKILKKSRLMQVSEFNTMVNSLQRFKEDLAVRALTGKKNIRSQKTQDRVFFSVLEKMLMEVSHETSSLNASPHAAEQQLLALRKVYMWFQSNKNVLVRSDGYFPSARKITEEIHSKIARKRVAAGKKSAFGIKLKTIDGHLEELQALQEEIASSRNMDTGSSMFAPSPTQDLTSIDSTTTRDKGFYQEDMDFAREYIDHEYFSSNRVERINRPMTAPPRMKKVTKPPTEPIETRDMTLQYGLKPMSRPRPQSALHEVKHELSWAKISPTPLAKLINKKLEPEKDLDQKVKKIEITIPSEHASAPPSSPEVITDPNRIAKLVMFKEYCVQHAAQQEGFMKQYVHHKHATRQHFLEFPENRTETAVRKTARKLHHQNPHRTFRTRKPEMTEYQDLSLEEFLNKDSPAIATSQDFTDNMDSARSNSAPARLVLSNGAGDASNSTHHLNFRTPKPPAARLTVVQPRQENVTVSSVFNLADCTGKRMNNIKEQVLSAPQHGWRYPMIPMATSEEELPKSASGVVLALHDGDKIKHKVLIPLSAAESTKSVEAFTGIGDREEELEALGELHGRYNTPRGISSRAKSAKSLTSEGSASRPLTRPQSTPRYLTGVTAVYRQFKSGARALADENVVDGEYYYDGYNVLGLRSAGTTRGPSRPRTAASLGSYPAQSEVSKSIGAASHHSTGTLRHRSVAESMRVRSVTKFRDRGPGSGRSSASSYVAQLRAKQRAGGNLPVRPTGRKKKQESGFHRVQVSETPASIPQLSFVSIVAPMHVPSDLVGTTYAPPGGVYCGTTAAVAKATDYKELGVDDLDFEEGLSLEDYHSVAKEKGAEEQSEGEQDNWLSKWLSGGPLDGLQNGDEHGGAATYADLVSRAAIIDSSDERTYSDEQESSTDAAALQVGTPDHLEFALSPRSDPLQSEDQHDVESMLPKSTFAKEDRGGSSSSGKLTIGEASPRSSLSSVETHGSSASEEEEVREDDQQETSTIHDEEDQVSKEQDHASDIEDPEDEDLASETTSTMSQDSQGLDVGDVGGQEEETVVFKVEEMKVEIQEAVREVVDELILTVHDSKANKNDEPQQMRNGDVIEKDRTVQEHEELEVDGRSEKVVDDIAVDDKETSSEEGDAEEEEENEEEETGSERPSSGSDIADSESSFESDREIIYDTVVPIKVIITPARKVERQLQKERNSAKAERDGKEMIPTSQDSPKSSSDSNSMNTDTNKTQHEKETCDSATSGTESNEGPTVLSEDNVDTRLITKEEIEAVTALSRPASGRPIPDEKEVRDPFVDMVATTRQRQIQRGVDVQAIFSGSSQGAETNKTIEVEKCEAEAALKMQRAYRRHLSRRRAARKCQGMSQETLEWARSYKALLKEKSERRKQRLQDSRNSLRTAERREMQRINRVGPHHAVYEVFHPEPELPDSEVIQDSAVEIQRYIRGWLMRNQLGRVREKVKHMGLPGMDSAVGEYRRILKRTQERHGQMHPSLFLTYEELESYLDQKKKFEIMFKKRQFWNEMESNELAAFFNDCGLYPSKEEISVAWDSVRKSRDINRERRKMKSKTAMTVDDVLEVAFYIYVPDGARMDVGHTRSSTWLNPVVDGKEGLKLREHDDRDQYLEEADIAKVGKLVAQTYKERNDAANE